LLLRSLFFSLRRLPPRSTLFPYTTLFRSCQRWCRYGVRPCVRAYLHRTSHSEGFKSGSDGRPGARISPTSVCIREAAESVMRRRDRKSTRLNSSHLGISYAVFCLKKKRKI